MMWGGVWVRWRGAMEEGGGVGAHEDSGRMRERLWAVGAGALISCA